MGYAFPVGNIYVSDDWRGHKNRTPPSSEPGTDYASAYGTNVVAVADGTVIDLKTTSSGAMGRYVTIRYTDGRCGRGLHMSSVSVSMNQRVSRGQFIGKSGASANGSDWGVGAHLHQTLWPTGTPFAQPTIDFELYVGGSTPQPEPEPPDDQEDEMALRMMHWTGGSVSLNPPATNSATRRAIWNEGSGYFMEWTESGATYANSMATNWQTGSSVGMTQSLANAIFRSCLLVRPPAAGAASATSAAVED